jgi:hypothetical protein
MPAFSFIDIPDHGRVTRDKLPNLCPHCSHKVNAEELVWGISSTVEGRSPDLECVFRCVNVECARIFIAQYTLSTRTPSSDIERLAQSIGHFGSIFKLTASHPAQIPRSTFSPEIENASPNFIEAYHQAEEAEARGLDQVCGLGYRKAIEYLIKDYCIHNSPAAEAKIKAMPVAQCISRHINDPRIESAVKRAVWLGNDEAHYVRKWINKDIDDLKVLIRLSTNWIESSLLTERYANEMPQKP